MKRVDHFPFDLLTASVEDKKNYFLERTVNHPILNNTFSNVMDKINDAPRGKVFLVFGPTGVGKSTLCRRVNNEIIIKYLEHNNTDKGTIPIIMLEIPAPENGKFNWRDFYKRMLKELNEPLIEHKITNNTEERVEKKRKIPVHLPSTAPELRESLENAIRYRKTKIILLDEAQHLLKIASGKDPKDHLDAIKSIANLTGSIIVMFGTYDLTDFFNLNGQLGRRTNEIHFPRYNAEIDKEIKEFKSVINTFQNKLPFYEETNLLQYWDFLYERSIGCIGILKEWLDECVKEALNKNQSAITYEILEKTAPSPAKALTIAEETISGEEKVREQGESSYLLREKLGLRKNKKSKNEESIEKSSSKKKKDVGKRNPTRDQVGISESSGY